MKKLIKSLFQDYWKQWKRKNKTAIGRKDWMKRQIIKNQIN